MPPPIRSPEVSLSAIDAEIATQKECLRQLYHRRNTHAFINQLPLELLTRIMHVIKTDAMQLYGGYCWIKVAHICQYWRRVALDCSPLWATLEVLVPGLWWIKELCKRSRSAPLSLVSISSHSDFLRRIQGTPKRDQMLASTLRKELRRVEVLRIALPSDRAKTFLENLTMPADQLTRLFISNPPLQSLELPDNLFGCHLPVLRNLDLEQCSFRWDTPLLAGSLQVLRIREPTVRLQVEQFSQVVQSLPLLQKLHLFFVTAPPDRTRVTAGEGDGEGGTRASAADQVHLRFLRELHIADTHGGAIARLLSQLRLNDDVVLNFYLNGRDSDSYEFLEGAIIGTLLKHLRSKPGFNLRMSSLDGLPGSAIMGFTGVFTSIERDNRFRLEFSIGNEEFGINREMERWFVLLEDMSLLRSMRECEIGYGMVVPDAIFREMWRSPALESVVLGGANDFYERLVSWIPQCDAHKWVESWEGDFGSRSGHWDRGMSESTSTSAGLGGFDEETDNGFMIGAGTAINLPVSPCEECEKLGKHFFHALRQLVFREPSLSAWIGTTGTGTAQRHPILEFIVQRIRCNLPIAAIVFKEGSVTRTTELSRSLVERNFQCLCGEYGPSITFGRD